MTECETWVTSILEQAAKSLYKAASNVGAPSLEECEQMSKDMPGPQGEHDIGMIYLYRLGHHEGFRSGFEAAAFFIRGIEDQILADSKHQSQRQRQRARKVAQI